MQILLTVIIFVYFFFCRLFVNYFFSGGLLLIFSQWLLCSCGSKESLLLQACHCFLRPCLANENICISVFYKFILFSKLPLQISLNDVKSEDQFIYWPFRFLQSLGIQACSGFLSGPFTVEIFINIADICCNFTD